MPLEIIQADHTKMNVMIVDEIYRKPIGRCYITVALDVFSRAVTGYCLSLDPSGLLTTGICLSHSILPKDAWLEEFKIPAKCPVYGKPRTLLVDIRL